MCLPLTWFGSFYVFIYATVCSVMGRCFLHEGLGVCVRDVSGAKMIHRRLTPPARKTKPLQHIKLYLWILALISVRPPVLGIFHDEYLC